MEDENEVVAKTRMREESGTGRQMISERASLKQICTIFWPFPPSTSRPDRGAQLYKCKRITIYSLIDN